MKKSITQEFEYGCGIACYAFALNITYYEATKRLGTNQSQSTRFWVKDITKALNDAGLDYEARHIKENARDIKYAQNSIVLIRRSKHYPSGHYLIRYNESWMDSWINLPFSNDINQAKSGFRKRLPGKAMYVVSPQVS